MYAYDHVKMEYRRRDDRSPYNKPYDDEFECDS